MTKREVLNMVVNGEVNEEVIAWAHAQLEQLDAQNAKRREKNAEKANENAPLVERIVTEILGEELMTATQVGEALGVSTQKASALCRRAVREERANVEDVKIKGKGTQKGYTVA